MKKIKYYIEGKIKRMLRKWLKKRVYRQGISFSSNEERFKWIYDAPLREWKDRLIIERDEVQQRLSSLTSALMQEDFREKVGSKQYYWMQEQRNAMEIYVEVLNKRITHAINNK